MDIKDAIIRNSQNNKLRCADALAIARDLEVQTAVIGRMCNELDIKIVQCQLGCFP